MEVKMAGITELLAFGVKNKASDLHLSAGMPPMLRVHGEMKKVQLPVMEEKQVHEMLYEIMNDVQRKVFEEIREYYNYILIDTPPIGTVIDAAVIGRCCDGAVFLIEPGNVRYRDAQKAFKQLERSGCRILGAVMNKIDTSDDKYYSSYYKHYGEYYHRSDEEAQIK